MVEFDFNTDINELSQLFKTKLFELDKIFNKNISANELFASNSPRSLIFIAPYGYTRYNNTYLPSRTR